MKTHELAKQLNILATALKKGPNINLNDLSTAAGNESLPSQAEMAVGISTLSELSRIGRREWVTFVDDHNIPVKFNSRDSARNIIGKIMTYLADHSEARAKLTENLDQNKGSSSKRLDQALSILLKVD